MQLPNVEYYPWNTHSVHWEGYDLIISGWALPPRKMEKEVSIFCNGLKASLTEWRESPDVEKIFPTWPACGKSSFSARWIDFGRHEFLMIEVRSEGEPPLSRKHSFAFAPDSLNYIRIPPPEVMGGIGNLDDHGFIQTGATLAFQFNRILREASGKGLDEFGSILDWGCGSGRVIQHIKRNYVSPNAYIAGLDVDPTAVLWCSKNISGIDFGNCDLSPPSKFPDNHFDVVYAYSVLTHLREADAVKWVSEIRRILKPGGYFMFTTLGDSALDWLHPNGNKEIENKLVTSGIWDLAKNTDIDGVIEDQEYYRNTWVTDDYVKNSWGSSLSFRHSEKCFHFYQDIWVFQK